MNRSDYLLLHSCGALLDELLGDAGAAASGTDGEGFGLGQQLVVGHLDAVLFGQLDRKSTRLNSSHMPKSRMPSSA